MSCFSSTCSSCLLGSGCQWCDGSCFDMSLSCPTPSVTTAGECPSSGVSGVTLIWAIMGSSFLLILLILIPVLICCFRRRRRTQYTIVGNIQGNPQVSAYRAPPPHYNTAYTQPHMPTNYSAYGTAPYQYQQPFQHAPVQPAPAMHAPYNLPPAQAPPQNFAPSAPE